MDILGLGMADGAELRVHPTGKAVRAALGADPGPGPRDDVRPDRRARRLGIPPEDIEVVHGDTDNTPFGLGTYGSRSTPVSGAAVAVAARTVVDKARIIAAAMLEVLAGRPRVGARARCSVKGDPTDGQDDPGDRAGRARRRSSCPTAWRATSTRRASTTRRTSPIPFGAYICVVDVDPGTGVVKVRRFIAVDDCGPRINPMIVEGQVHGGLADGVGMALMEVIAFDEDGNCLGGSFMDYLLPTVDGVPDVGARRDRHAVAAPPDRGQGRRRVRHRRLAARRGQRGASTR